MLKKIFQKLAGQRSGFLVVVIAVKVVVARCSTTVVHVRKFTMCCPQIQLDLVVDVKLDGSIAHWALLHSHIVATLAVDKQ